MSLLLKFHKDCKHYYKASCPGAMSNNGIPPLPSDCKYHSLRLEPKPTKPEKTYTAALREKLKYYFGINKRYNVPEEDIECAIKTIVRLNKRYGK